MAMRVEEITDKKVWEKFVLGQRPNVFLQSWNWGEFHQNLGNWICRLGVFDKSQLVGAALLVIEKAKRGTFLSCPGGPLLANWKKENLEIFVKEMIKIAKEKGAVFVRTRPTIEASDRNKRLFQGLGFRDASVHMHAETTWQLSLDLPEENLLANMRKTTRYSIRKAEKEGVKLYQSGDSKDIEILYKLQMETVKRQKFSPFSLEYIQKQFRTFISDNQALLLLAKYKNEILSAAMFIFYGDTAVYHYSGNSLEHPRVCASYFLLWVAIKEAKKRGCKVFNFWGIAPTDDSSHPWAGLTLFKKGFGGERIDYLHAQDLPLSKLYWFTYFFETLRRIYRGL